MTQATSETEAWELLGHIPAFVGDIWYVNAALTSGSGYAPDVAFKTITEGITAAKAGDRIVIKAGTYNENGLDLNLAGMELIGEIGVLITNDTPGTCLTISGDTCSVIGVVCQQASNIGFAITGSGAYLADCIGSNNSVAFDIDGVNCRLVRCQDQDATTTGFDISNSGNLLYLCSSIATGSTSRGFYLSHANADQNLLYQCTSQGNGTAGFETVSGANYNVFGFCTSGGADGARVDGGTYNTWPNFSFENKLHVVQTFGGGGGDSTNLFRVYGIVQVKFIYGIVETDLSADVDNISLDVFPLAGLLIALATLVDSASAPAGSMLIKKSDSGNALVLKSALVPFISEDDTKQKPFTETIIGEQGDGTATYIRSTYSGVATSGAIDWHIEWEPLSDDGFIKAV